MNYKRIAHRGFSSEAPENTAAAFALAAEGDFYGVECDIWRSLDGEYVVSHDGNLKRMCGEDIDIPQTSYRSIKKCTIQAGKKRTFHPAQHPITLEQYLSILCRNDQIHPIIELKMDYDTKQLAEILQTVRNYQLEERTYFISMHPLVLLRLKDELSFPSERLQYVYGVPRPSKTIPVGDALVNWLVEHRINLDTRFQLLTPGAVYRLHQAGLEINVWTVNKKEDFRKMVDLGVDMLTTEYYFQDCEIGGEKRC